VADGEAPCFSCLTLAKTKCVCIFLLLLLLLILLFNLAFKISYIDENKEHIDIIRYCKCTVYSYDFTETTVADGEASCFSCLTLAKTKCICIFLLLLLFIYSYYFYYFYFCIILTN